MLVSSRKYHEAMALVDALSSKIGELIHEQNTIVDQVNDKGGQQFLDKGVLLSDDQIKTLIKLCHPDKHQGKESASEMTKLLLSLKQSKE